MADGPHLNPPGKEGVFLLFDLVPFASSYVSGCIMCHLMIPLFLLLFVVCCLLSLHCVCVCVVLSLLYRLFAIHMCVGLFMLCVLSVMFCVCCACMCLVFSRYGFVFLLCLCLDMFCVFV